LSLQKLGKGREGETGARRRLWRGKRGKVRSKNLARRRGDSLHGKEAYGGKGGNRRLRHLEKDLK